MTLNDVLSELLEHLGTALKSVTFDWDAIQEWPQGALAALLQEKLLTPTTSAQSLECNGCEHRCFMDVLTFVDDAKKVTRAFIVCDEPEKQSEMGRISIPLERLEQWKTSHKHFAKAIVGLLSLNDEIKIENNAFRLGMLKSDKGRRWLSLNVQPLTLEANRNAVSLGDVLFFEGDALCIDYERIKVLINSEPLNTGKEYHPTTSKRDARKQATEAMYQDWQDQYQWFRKKHPNKNTHSDSWIARQIEKMDIASNRSANTISRHMK